jgi:uncharacterized repeat protein (TIGR01451 family)
MNTKEKIMKKLMVIASMMLLGSIQVFALTTAGTDIANTATLSYDVGGTSQTSISASDAGFKVDRKIDVLVTNQDNTDGVKTVNVTPAQQDVVLTFAINNAGNDAETYQLTLDDTVAGDQFDPQSCEISVDGGSNWVAASTNPAINIAQEETSNALVRCDIPPAAPASGGVNDSDNGSVVLTATVQGRTNDNNNADDPAAVQNVFADGAGQTDSANNGDYSDIGTYHVVSPNLTMTKTSMVTDDPVYNGGAGAAAEPHRIPGATVRYCFQIDNTGTADASNVQINDDFTVDNKNNLTYVNSGFVKQGIGTACDCAGITDTSGSFTSPNVTIPIGTITGTGTPATQRACAYIEATIN